MSIGALIGALNDERLPDSRVPREARTLPLDHFPTQSEDIKEYRRYVDKMLKEIVEKINKVPEFFIPVRYNEPESPRIGEMAICLPNPPENTFWDPDGSGDAGVYAYYPKFEAAKQEEIPTWNRIA